MQIDRFFILIIQKLFFIGCLFLKALFQTLLLFLFQIHIVLLNASLSCNTLLWRNWTEIHQLFPQDLSIIAWSRLLIFRKNKSVMLKLSGYFRISFVFNIIDIVTVLSIFIQLSFAHSYLQPDDNLLIYFFFFESRGHFFLFPVEGIKFIFNWMLITGIF